MPLKYYELKSLGLKTNFEIKSEHRLKKYVTDRVFAERVRQYIQDNMHKGMIDGNDLVNSLRAQFPIYKRRQKAAMKSLAGLVVANMIQENDQYPDSCDEEINSDVSNLSAISSDEDIENTSSNISNTILNLYNAKSEPEIEGTPRLITISSDEDNNPEVIEWDKTVKTPKRKLPPNEQQSEYEVLRLSKESRKTTTIEEVSEKQPKSPMSVNSRSMIEVEDIIDNDTASGKNIPNITFADVAGCKHVLSEVMQLIVHIYHPEVYNHIGIDPPRGFLLHGPPGCGKTLLANAVAGELKIPLLDVAAPELVTGISGKSEQRIRELFENAMKTSPCVLFIDEIDCITQNRDVSNRDMERRIVSQLLSSLDKLNKDPKGAQVLVIGATNRPDSLDPALRRAGRFDREVTMGIPDKESRLDILEFLCSKLKLADDVMLKQIANNTPGYVGADLLSLIRESALSAVNRAMKNVTNPMDTVNHTDSMLENVVEPLEKSVSEYITDSLAWVKNKTPISEEYLKSIRITSEDFAISLKRVQPSSKREGFATVPDVTWDDVGSLKDIRRDLQLTILAPVKYQKQFNELGLPLSMGVLLCGPPGCGKTLLAKAVANEAGINFISVKGPELLNMYVGGSEKAVRECFQRAKNSKPCVIFFDEIDALCPKRSDSSENSAGMRVVNQLLTEMDGVEGRPGVLLMAATNRPDIIDPAVLRPGRLDKILYVGFPNEEDRVDILRALTKNGTKPKLSDDVSLENVAKNPLCDGFTGADLAALIRDASMLALSEVISRNTDDDCPKPIAICSSHLEQALRNLRPSVSEKDRKHYDYLRLKFATSAYNLQTKDSIV